MKTAFVVILAMFLLAMIRPPLKNGTPVLSQKTFLHSDVPLQGTRWQLIGISGQTIPLSAAAQKMYLVLKSDSTVNGNGGCNTFSGNYSLGKDNQISFGEMVRTNVLCSGVNYEKDYLNALAKADHYTIHGDTLILKNELVNLLKFTAGK